MTGTRAAAVQLQTNVTSAKADPTSEALRDVGTGLRHLRRTIGNLAAIVGNGC